MSIYEYNEGDHPGQFIGLRVVVMVNGKVNQKYFCFRKKPGVYISLEQENILRQKAISLNKKWLKQQAKSRKQNKQNIDQYYHMRQSIYNTGVRGISARFAIEKRWRGGEYRTYYSPIFKMQIRVNGKNFYGSFYINESIQESWDKTIEKYTKIKKITNKTPFLEKAPTIDHFKKIRHYLNKQGFNIPLSQLPKA